MSIEQRTWQILSIDFFCPCFCVSECVIHVCVLVVGVHMLDVSNLSLFHKDVFYSMMTVMDLAIPEFMAL